MNREALFREAVRENETRIVRICSLYFDDPQDRADAVQETLIRIWENLHTFRGASKLSTWIYRVTVNTCLINIRSTRKRTKLTFPILSDQIQWPVLPGDHGGDCDVEEARSKFLQGSLQTLNSIDRTLVLLCAEGLSTREMADITGLSESNVRVRVHRVRDRIKTEWEERKHENIGKL